MCPLLVPSPEAAIDRTDEYTVERRSWFKRGKFYDAVGEDVVRWLTRFWSDLDVREGPGKRDINAIREIVAHAGRFLEGDLIYKKERQTKTVLDIGVLRYPDINCPYIKVYRIELVAWYQSTTVGVYSRDKNGLMATFNLRQYEPDADAIAEIRRNWRRDALENYATLDAKI
ncbi:hypothetical protein AURDEDRAFT_123945 [Auricularia subglabra TFB-10046 SS5]|nr:hypothetical protein AURDEDRAFT_123945 [Auricularia subglabra TFB-10046 SS5]